MEWATPLYKVCHHMSKCVSFSQLITTHNKTKSHLEKCHHHTDWLKVYDTVSISSKGRNYSSGCYIQTALRPNQPPILAATVVSEGVNQASNKDKHPTAYLVLVHRFFTWHPTYPCSYMYKQPVPTVVGVSQF